MVGDTGLELQNEGGQLAPIFTTQNPQTEVSTQVASLSSGHVVSQRGQLNDAFGAAPCCTGVAQNVEGVDRLQSELAIVVRRWHTLPEHIRMAVMALVQL